MLNMVHGEFSCVFTNQYGALPNGPVQAVQGTNFPKLVRAWFVQRAALASATVSAVMLTMRRTVAEGVKM
jgi:hypothetical protein